MPFEIRKTKNEIRQLFAQNGEANTKFFTGDDKSPINLRSIKAEQHEGKSIVSVLNSSHKDACPDSYKYFILDPSLGKDTSSFINGFKEFIIGESK